MIEVGIYTCLKYLIPVKPQYNGKDMMVDYTKVRLRKSSHANLCSKNQFFRENVGVIAILELRPGSNER